MKLFGSARRPTQDSYDVSVAYTGVSGAPDGVGEACFDPECVSACFDADTGLGAGTRLECDQTGWRPAGRLGRLLRGDAGMATAEYAVATLAACGFAGLLLIILRSDEVRALLLGIIQRALNVG